MDRVKILIFVDILALVSFIVSVVTGIVLWQVFPTGTGFQGGRNTDILTDYMGLVKHDWINIHNLSSMILVSIVIYHLILHWNWIKRVPQMIRK